MGPRTAEEKHWEGGNAYNKYESTNPLVRHIMRRFLEDIEYAVRDVNPRRILEAGCGEGYVTAQLQQYGVEQTAFDVDESVLEEARERAPNATFYQDDITNIGQKDGSFDLVMALEVLEHLSEPAAAVKELKRVSSDHVLVSVPHEPFWRIANLCRGAYITHLGNTPGHKQNFTYFAFKNLLEDHFTDVTVKPSNLWLIGVCRV